jgi:hypothetical protein
MVGMGGAKHLALHHNEPKEKNSRSTRAFSAAKTHKYNNNNREIKKETPIFLFRCFSSTPKTANKQAAETTKHCYTVSNT